MTTTAPTLTRIQPPAPGAPPEAWAQLRALRETIPELAMEASDLHPHAALILLALANAPGGPHTLGHVLLWCPWLTMGQARWALGQLWEAHLVERSMEDRTVVYYLMGRAS